MFLESIYIASEALGVSLANPYLLPALIGGGLGLIGSGISAAINRNNVKDNNYTNILLTRETNENQYKIAQQANQLQSRENQLTRNWSSQEAELAYQRELEKMDIQHQLNSPLELVRQMRSAGLNPTFAGDMSGAGSVSSTSAAQASGAPGFNPAMPQMINPAQFNQQLPPWPNFVEGVADTFLKLASARQQLSSSDLNDANADSIRKTLGATIDKLTAETELMQIQKTLQETFGADLAQSQIAVYEKQALDFASQANLNEAFAAHEEFKKELTKSLSQLHGNEAQILKNQLDNWDTLFAQQLRNLAADTRAKNASANLGNAQANEISTLLQGKVDLQKSQIELNKKQAEYTGEQILTQPHIRKQIIHETLGIIEDNTTKYLENTEREKIIAHLDEQLQLSAQQKRQDLYNPFHYIGAVFGGSAAAAITTSGKPSGAVRVVTGFK